MVYFLGGDEPPGSLALFAERVRRDISVTNPFPCPPVPLVGIGVAPVCVILPCVLLGMGRAETGVS